MNEGIQIGLVVLGGLLYMYILLTRDIHEGRMDKAKLETNGKTD